MTPTDPHVFLSYVHEDAAAVDELQAALEAGGIKVWRDRDDLGPGDDWKAKIKAAITSGALAFIGCFSEESEKKEKSGQREELILATDEIRARRLDRKWFFPVRFSAVDLPYYDVGAGRTLESFQYKNLFGATKDTDTVKVVVAIRDLFRDAGLAVSGAAPAAPAPEEATAQLKRDLLDPTRRADVASYTTRVTREVRAAITDSATFPFNPPDEASSVDRVQEIIRQERAYRAAVRPALECIVAGCEWGGQEHLSMWTRMIASLSRERPPEKGNLVRYTGFLSDFARLPALLAMCAGAISAVNAGNYDAFRAVTVDPSVEQAPQGWGAHSTKVPAIQHLAPWAVFSSDKPLACAVMVAARDEPDDLPAATLRTLIEGGGRQPETPISTYLHIVLRDVFSGLDDDEFSETFDRAEVLLALLIADRQANTRKWVAQPWIGRFAEQEFQTMGDSEYGRVVSEAKSLGESWGPVAAGLFGGSADRLDAAIAGYESVLSEWRNKRQGRAV